LLEFEKALKFPFKNWKRMFNILWVLIPIFGWFAIFGYMIKIVKQFFNGDYSELPQFEFGENLSYGFIMFVKLIPFMIALSIVNIVLMLIPIIGFLAYLVVAIFIAPILVMNFLNEETVSSCFDFSIVSAVFDNIKDYCMALLKTIALAVIFGILSIVLIGIPALYFTQNIFLAEFYTKYVK